MTISTRLSETAGTVAGIVLAPLTAAVSGLRHARVFHPDGVLYRGQATVADDTPWPEVAARLAGPILTRWSSAWWRGGREWPDVLGLAIRFRAADPLTVEAAPGDQDLLLATIRRWWTTLLAPLGTHVHDFLANDYYGVSPFTVAGIGPAALRVVSVQTAPAADSRPARLARAVQLGAAHAHLQVRPHGEREWRPLVELRLTSPVELDQRALRFSPFHVGRGLRPTGFVHALRVATYASSQAVRQTPSLRPARSA